MDNKKFFNIFQNLIIQLEIEKDNKKRINYKK